MTALTPRQAQVLKLIHDHVENTGYPPTRAEIAKSLGFRSLNAAEEHLKALARKGSIEMLPGTSRGIRIKKGPGFPVVGEIKENGSILAEQNIEGHCQLDLSLFKTKPDYLLRMQDMSMKNVGILEGDLLAVCNASEAKAGQIVVVRLKDGIVIRRYKPKAYEVELTADNPDFKPIKVDLRRELLEIEGVGVGVVRNTMAL